MPDKILDHLLESRLFAPFVSFVGVAIMVLWKRDIDRRRMAVAVLSAPAFTLLVVPLIVAWIRTMPSLAWLPKDGSVEGLIGLIVGITALNIVSMVLRVGASAETAAVNRVGGQ